MLTKQDILKQLLSKKSSLDSFGVKRLGLFGSYAKNTQTKSSDLDFIVEFKKGQKKYDNFFHLSEFLEKLFKKNVDLLTQKGISPYMKASILEQVDYFEF